MDDFDLDVYRLNKKFIQKGNNIYYKHLRERSLYDDKNLDK
jgi:hypothetical protein